MNAVTEYPRPSVRYRREAQRSPWRPLGGWHLRESGDWARVYTAGRRTQARRAVVFLERGWWRWHVEEFDLETRQVRRICNRSRAGTGHYASAAAFPWADAAARTSD